jgi:predicted nucleotidyltransferase
MGIAEKWRGLKPLPDNIRERLGLLVTLFEEAEVLLAYVFGSFLHTEASDDIDLAVLPGRRGLENLREKICETLSTQRVDLVNLKTASPLLRFEVLSTGSLIFKKNEPVENHFELSVIREYRDTAHLRKSQARMLEERKKKRWS